MNKFVGAGLMFCCGLFSILCESSEYLQADKVAEFETFDARQAVAVDRDAFYAVNNFRITKHEKNSGKPLLQWDGITEGETLIHLDSAVVWEGKLFAAHSNYPSWPMTSSVEIWDTQTMQHIGSHSLGIALGSFTWLDRYQQHWWGAFGNYDKVQRGQDKPYGETRNTQVVKMDDAFNILEAWTLPAEILQRMRPMSNSGGSWSEDGYLYVTGHDHPEIYVLQLPQYGSELEWVTTIQVPELNGQGIAWDRSGGGRQLWGILKKDRKVFRWRMPDITSVDARKPGSVIRADGEFARD
ncbi:hypothetical protein [Microbulbifer aggregans]|uniref:hypothetical protein n=1 Tax=Microbulbifer aggregans TaxID=1769779 RepID=UPI001CFF29EB|nr:hypothetical protein [Microbulbifer aggregans]